MHKIICSHGFGVDATDRGLFTDIAAASPALEFVMFDYNEIDESGNMTVRPLEKQVELLNEQLQRAGQPVVLLGHSQGCVTAAMSDLANVNRLVFLAPPDNLDIERFVRVFGKRPGAQFDPGGISSIPRRDGTTTYIGKDYLDSIAKVDVLEVFTAVAAKVPTTIIRAASDEIVGETDFSTTGAEIKTLPGSHDFADENRTKLCNVLRDLLK